MSHCLHLIHSFLKIEFSENQVSTDQGIGLQRSKRSHLEGACLQGRTQTLRPGSQEDKRNNLNSASIPLRRSVSVVNLSSEYDNLVPLAGFGA
jgi:hypothetical protein